MSTRFFMRFVKNFDEESQKSKLNKDLSIIDTLRGRGYSKKTLKVDLMYMGQQQGAPGDHKNGKTFFFWRRGRQLLSPWK